MGMMYEYEDYRDGWLSRTTTADSGDAAYWKVLIPRRPVNPQADELDACLADFEWQMKEGK